MNVQVFIMGAGQGSRIKYGLGKKIPKCLIPAGLVSPKVELCCPDTILDRIVKSFKNVSQIGGHSIKIDLMISHKSEKIANYINSNFPDINLHQIDWSPSSVSTFKKCFEIAESQNQKFDKYIFINGDTYIDNVESISYTLNDLIELGTNSTSAVIENFKNPQHVWSSVSDINTNSHSLSSINPNYVDTNYTLCDITQFNYYSLKKLYNKICSGKFKHEWWEMAFIEDINSREYPLGFVFVRKTSYDRVLYNTNDINENASKEVVDALLKEFGLNFDEEETFDVKE